MIFLTVTVNVRVVPFSAVTVKVLLSLYLFELVSEYVSVRPVFAQYSAFCAPPSDGLPLIVTTNLTLDALKHPDDLAHARIYDRILEICAPILFGGENLRVEKANEMKTAARNLLLPGNAA